MKKTLISAAIAGTMVSNISYATQLDPVVVTANNLKQPLSTVTSTTYILTRDDIEERGWETIAEALSSLPGINISRNGGPGTSTSVHVRGQSGQGVLFMIDGEMIADPSNISLSPLVENLSLDQVERIEVVLGPQSGIWGANASGGVINIITRKAGRQTLLLETGSENSRRISATASKKSERYSLLASIASLNTEGYTAVKKFGTSGKHDEKDGFQQDDVLFKASISPTPDHTVGFSLQHTAATTEFDNPNDPNETATYNERDLLNKRAWYAYQHDRFNMKLSVSEYTVDRTSYSAYGPYSAHGNLTSWQALAGYAYAPESTLQVIAGNQRIQGNTDAYWHDFAGLTHVHRLGPLYFTEAVRQDHFDKFEDATTGKIGFKLPFKKGFSLQGNYGTSYNAPSAFQVGYGATQNLKPESGEGWDLGLSILGATLTYYEQTVKDAIIYAGTWPNDYYTNANGKNHYSGWEFSYERGWGDWHIGLNYTWQEARDDNHTFLARIPHDKGTLTLDYYGLPKWHIGTEIRHVGDYYDTAGSSGENLGNYTLVNLKVDYTINRNFTVYAKAINLFDKDYYTAADQANPHQYGYNTGGFQWRIGLNGTF